MRFDEAMDSVQLRDGASYVGEVTTANLTLKTLASDAPLSIATSNIVSVVFRSGGLSFDRVQLKDASELSGTVMQQQIGFRSDALGQIQIPTQSILAIQFLTSIGD